MKLISNENSLKANKSWFFFDKEVVCLGSCINSEEESEVETIIENRLVTDNSRFTVHGNEESEGYIIKLILMVVMMWATVSRRNRR